MDTPTESLKDLDVPRSCTPIVSIVIPTFEPLGDPRYDLVDVEFQDL
jgi:hypothetical protein